MSKRVLSGVVLSDSCDKTIVVKVERKFKHAMYKKYIKRSKKYHVHDENNTYKVGDLVEIAECKPYSKLKTWEVNPDKI